MLATTNTSRVSICVMNVLGLQRHGTLDPVTFNGSGEKFFSTETPSMIISVTPRLFCNQIPTSQKLEHAASVFKSKLDIAFAVLLPAERS